MPTPLVLLESVSGEGPSGMRSTVPDMTELGTDWRVVDGVATAWFDAASLVEGAALGGRVAELSPDIVVDLRATGVRVRLDRIEQGDAVSAVARDLGLSATACSSWASWSSPPTPL